MSDNDKCKIMEVRRDEKGEIVLVRDYKPGDRASWRGIPGRIARYADRTGGIRQLRWIADDPAQLKAECDRLGLVASIGLYFELDGTPSRFRQPTASVDSTPLKLE